MLTTNLFASFHAYCLRVELDPELLAGRFRKDPEARELLIALEKGEIDEPAFEQRFAKLLGVAPDGLIDGLFTEVAPDLSRCSTPCAAPTPPGSARGSCRTPGACTATRTSCSTSCSTAS